MALEPDSWGVAVSSADDVARAAYAAYKEAQEESGAWAVPTWDMLPTDTRDAWIAATKVARGWDVSRGSKLTVHRGHGPVTMRAGAKGPKRERVHATLREGRLDWYRIENRAGDAAAVHIYDEIGYFGTTAADFVQELAAVKAKTLDVHINSPGGEVWDGVAIHNAIKRHPANVTVHIDGLAASAASFIAMAGDEIVIEPNAQMMIHDAMTLMVGNAAEMRETAKMLDKTSDTIAQMYADRAGGDVADWRKAMRAETWYDGAEAVEAGLADRLAGEGEDEAPADRKVAAKFDLSVFRFAGREAARAQAVDESVDGDEEITDEGGGDDEDTAGEAVESEPVFAFDPSELAGAFRAAVTAALPAEPEPVAFDPALFRAAVTVAATDAPEPYTPSVQPFEADDPIVYADWRSAFRRSLKEAAL